jgi:hypothetical protein
MSPALVPPVSAAIVTSRLKRLIAPDEPWLIGLRGALRQIAADGIRLRIAEGTAGAEFIRHGARRLEIPMESVSVVPDEDDGDFPAGDRAVMEFEDQVYVLGVRANGNIHRLLKKRLERRPEGVRVVDLPGLRSDSVHKELVDAGAVPWKPTEEQGSPWVTSANDLRAGSDHDVSEQEWVYTIVPFPSLESWDFLVHTTRACPGPWPDETFEDYADSLLESRPEADHSALGALMRIVKQKRLIASNRTIRGGSEVVSFTACPLMTLPELHRFRPHRVRWDFEPFGLCLRRDWLAGKGARPVVYGTDSEWDSLTESDRPFFQIGIGKSGIDWRIEREWRVPGDLSLDDVTPEDVILFVSSFEAAKRLKSVSDWPATIWPGETHSH